ncbi:hypothetical protein HAX54_008171 [Datura stramonium]|uniref:Uncharacterized protein n=1 Tax=Datura stramonium TaxID=4076 RepID=A0ABS8RV73_DATST|nr:hypothetical protein [Datura stramonium]
MGTGGVSSDVPMEGRNEIIECNTSSGPSIPPLMAIFLSFSCEPVPNEIGEPCDGNVVGEKCRERRGGFLAGWWLMRRHWCSCNNMRSSNSKRWVFVRLLCKL